MINLSQIILIFSWLVVPVSVWFIVYFSARIIMHYRARRALGDMPSAEEIHQLYQDNNSMIEHSPIVDRSDQI